LPKEVVLEIEETPELVASFAHTEGANVLSDAYGYCVNSFNFEVIETK
jgi:hypothetical protein